jgi:hypothetical protein
MEANTTAHDSDIIAALDSLTDLVSCEHELTNEALLENLTKVINELGIVQSNIQNEIDDVDETLDILKDDDSEGKEIQDSTYTLVLLGVVLLVLILIILLIVMMILIKENRKMRNNMGEGTEEIHSEEQLEQKKGPEDKEEKIEADD